MSYARLSRSGNDLAKSQSPLPAAAGRGLG